jgi:hypothetical protein
MKVNALSRWRVIVRPSGVMEERKNIGLPA